jgi:ElaB/YqjD/DUF883 family membrane-anchored ribosome-binding protein
MAAPKTTRTTAAPTVVADVDTSGSTVTGRFTIKNLPSLDVTEAAKPLYAYVGAADLVVEQVRAIPTSVRALPQQVKALRDDVETRVEKAGEKASDLYSQLTVRGERLVTSIRRQPSTEAAIAEGKEAVKKAEAAAVAARNSAKAGEHAVEDAAGKLG